MDQTSAPTACLSRIHDDPALAEPTPPLTRWAPDATVELGKDIAAIRG